MNPPVDARSRIDLARAAVGSRRWIPALQRASDHGDIRLGRIHFKSPFDYHVQPTRSHSHRPARVPTEPLDARRRVRPALPSARAHRAPRLARTTDAPRPSPGEVTDRTRPSLGRHRGGSDGPGTWGRSETGWVGMAHHTVQPRLRPCLRIPQRPRESVSTMNSPRPPSVLIRGWTFISPRGGERWTPNPGRRPPHRGNPPRRSGLT